MFAPFSPDAVGDESAGPLQHVFDVFAREFVELSVIRIVSNIRDSGNPLQGELFVNPGLRQRGIEAIDVCFRRIEDTLRVAEFTQGVFEDRACQRRRGNMIIAIEQAFGLFEDIAQHFRFNQRLQVGQQSPFEIIPRRLQDPGAAGQVV